MTMPDWLQLVGAAVFAMSGALAAARRGMDPFGVIVIAIVTAIGGGTIRDLLLDRHPVFWIEDPSHLVVSIVAAVFTLVYARARRPPTHSLAIADALGLALFTIVGAQIAEQEVRNPILIVLMGAMTGVAGGVIRDVLSAEIPLIFRKGELYATPAVAGAALFVLLDGMGISRPAPALTAMTAIVGLRLAAILWGWHLPIVPMRDD
jgi:uncharacterized membrane protein YeiH